MPISQPFQRESHAVPRSSALHQSSAPAHMSASIGSGLPAQAGSAYNGKPSLALQISPKLRGSLPILPEQQPAAGLERFALPSVASLPPERHLQPPAAAQSLPMAPRTFTSRREPRLPQPEQPYPSLMPIKHPQHSHSTSRDILNTVQQQQERQQVPVRGLGPLSEAEYRGSLIEDEAGHGRSGSGQEQGLAMAEQVINAYKLGLQASDASEATTGIPGKCTLCVNLCKVQSSHPIWPVTRRVPYSQAKLGCLFCELPIPYRYPVRVCLLAHHCPSLWGPRCCRVSGGERVSGCRGAGGSSVGQLGHPSGSAAAQD